MSTPGTWRLSLQEWRVFERVDWTLGGVCLLVGPNGSGKSTLLQVFRFLRLAYAEGVVKAVHGVGGPTHLRRLGANDWEPVVVEVEYATVRWRLEIAIEGGGIDPKHGETLWVDGVERLHRAMGGDAWSIDGEPQTRFELRERTGLRAWMDQQAPPELGPFVHFLESMRLYAQLNLPQLREMRGTPEGSRLQEHGRNLPWLLQNWKTSPRTSGDAFRWVIESLREVFPTLVDDIELELVSNFVSAVVYPPDSKISLPFHLMPDGVVATLLHLVAVVGAPAGSVVAFDEIENYLHPFALRRLLDRIRERAEERELTVVLATHSTVLISAFKGHEDQLFVLEPGEATVPTPLDELRDPDWLAHFDLGDLYENLQIGAPDTPKTVGS